MKKNVKKSNSKLSRMTRSSGVGSPSDRFQEAIKCVVRNLGGNSQFLLAAGYIPSAWKGYRPGFWVSPHNQNIMWKAKDAIGDYFIRFRWHDRAKAAEAKHGLKGES